MSGKTWLAARLANASTLQSLCEAVESSPRYLWSSELLTTAWHTAATLTTSPGVRTSLQAESSRRLLVRLLAEQRRLRPETWWNTLSCSV
eukprot:g18058.t1